jgi:hypothetical protein
VAESLASRTDLPGVGKMRESLSKRTRQRRRIRDIVVFLKMQFPEFRDAQPFNTGVSMGKIGNWRNSCERTASFWAERCVRGRNDRREGLGEDPVRWQDGSVKSVVPRESPLRGDPHQ